MAANATPKFWFDVDGRKFGARFLTISEQIQLQVDVERLTNGNFAAWMSSPDPMLANTAVMAQIASFLNKAIVAWPTDLPAFNFLESDDADFALKLWEGYGKAAADFRGQPSAGSASEGVV